MKKVLIKFRWVFYILVILMFLGLWLNEQRVINEIQSELIDELQEQYGVEIIKSKPAILSWHDKLPDSLRKFFPITYKLSVKVYRTDIEELNHLKNVHTLSVLNESDSYYYHKSPKIDLQFMEGFHSLENLEIRIDKLPDKFLSYISGFKNLKKLAISAEELPSSLLKDVIGLNIESLSITSDTRFSKNDLQKLKGSKVKELYLYHDDRYKFSELPPMNNLEYACLNDVNVKLNDLQISFPKLKNIFTWTLRTKQDFKVFEKMMSARLRKTPGFSKSTHIKTGMRVTDEQFKILNKVHFNNLTVLNPKQDLSVINWSNKKDVHITLNNEITHAGDHKIEDFMQALGITFQRKNLYQLTDRNFHIESKTRFDVDSYQNPGDVLELDLDINELTPQYMSKLNKFTKMQFLHIRALKGLEHLNLLKNKDLYELKIQSAAKPLQKLSGFKPTNLELVFEDNSELKSLLDLERCHCTNLIISTTSGCNVDLQGLEKFKNLLTLEIAHGRFTYSGKINFPVLEAARLTADTPAEIKHAVEKKLAEKVKQ